MKANVGAADELDDASIVGPHGHERRNMRGESSLRWCTVNKLVVANPFFAPANEGNLTSRKKRPGGQPAGLHFDGRLLVQHDV